MRLYSNWLKEDCSAFLNGDLSAKAVMKTIIRTGFELVMEQQEVYTTDLYLCYQCFSAIYSAQEPQMRRALHYFLNPPDQASELFPFVKRFGIWLEKVLENDLLSH